VYISILINMIVIDNSNGKKIGYIRDVKFNRENGMLESLIVSEGKNKLFARLISFFRQLEISRENIMMFGEDVVVVKMY